MEPIATTATAVEAIGILSQVRQWVKKGWGGSIEITEPHNRDTSDKQPWIPFKGKHTNPRGKFWLLTRNGNKFWPQRRLQLEHDGFWKSSINVNTKKETRTSTIVLARVWDFGDSLFDDYKKRGERTNWEPIEIRGYGKEFKIYQEMVITVLGSNQGG